MLGLFLWQNAYKIIKTPNLGCSYGDTNGGTLAPEVELYSFINQSLFSMRFPLDTI